MAYEILSGEWGVTGLATWIKAYSRLEHVDNVLSVIEPV